MTHKELTKCSRFISLILRHKPSEIGITLDGHGWANVDELLQGLSTKGYDICMNDLEHIVDTDEKQRYSFNDDKTLIRANQGHSIQVDVELQEIKSEDMPPILYHGTGKKYVESINKLGLIKKSRLYVHLSNNLETAINVGKRHGEPVVYEVDCKGMVSEGFKFYKSANNVWLTNSVPVKYLKVAGTTNLV